MTGGSQQLRIFRRAIRDGSSLTDAALAASMSMSEARSWVADDLRDPPPPEAFELLTPARCAPSEKEYDMVNPNKQPAVEQVFEPDFALAVRIWREDIKPAISRVGEFAQEQSTAFKAIKRDAHIQPQAAKAAFKIAEMEESQRDDYLRSLNGLLKEMNIGMPHDLVDAAEGVGLLPGESVIPVAQRARPKLVTMPQHPADDSDLNPTDAEDTALAAE